MLYRLAMLVVVLCASQAAGFAPATMIGATSKVALSNVRMEEEAPAEEKKDSVLPGLSGVPAEVLKSIESMTLLEASALIKDVEKTFGLNDDEDDDTAEE